MESNIVDELLTRIKSLENGNKNLKEQIENKKSQLASIGSTTDSKSTTPEAEMPGANEKVSFMSNDFSQIIDQRQSIIDNVKEMVIQYNPYEQFNSLCIMGDFTGWELIQMNKHQDIFSFTTILIKGFKYYYIICFRDQMIVDMNSLYETNPRTNQVNNYIDITDGINPSTLFDYKLHGNILIDARKNFSKVRMGNQDVCILEDLVIFSSRLREWTSYFNSKKSDYVNAIHKYFDTYLAKVKEISSENLRTLSEVFIGKILKSYDRIYEIQQISIPDKSIKCIKLYDVNGIKVNRQYHLDNKIYHHIYFKDYDKSLQILSQKDSENIIEQYNQSNQVLKIFYKLEDNNDTSSSQLPSENSQGKKIFSFGRYHRISPIRVEPERLNILGYSFEVSPGAIVSVKNIEDNLFVLFSGEEMKDLRNSKLPSFKIFYSFYKKTVNIIHIHSLNENSFPFDDTVTSVHVDKKNQDPKELTTISQEEGNIKIICRNYKPVKVLMRDSGCKQNDEMIIHEVKFEDMHLKLEKIVKLSTPTGNSFNNYYARITKIPVYLLAKLASEKITPNPEEITVGYEKVETCLFNNNQELPGYVDLEIIFDPQENFLDEPVCLSIPICMVTLISTGQEMDMVKRLFAQSKKVNSPEMTNFTKISDYVKNIGHFQTHPEVFKTLSQDKLKQMQKQIESCQGLMPKIGSYVERNEMWSYIEKIHELNLKLDTLHSLMTDYLNN